MATTVKYTEEVFENMNKSKSDAKQMVNLTINDYDYLIEEAAKKITNAIDNAMYSISGIAKPNSNDIFEKVSDSLSDVCDGCKDNIDDFVDGIIDIFNGSISNDEVSVQFILEEMGKSYKNYMSNQDYMEQHPAAVNEKLTKRIMDHMDYINEYMRPYDCQTYRSRRDVIGGAVREIVDAETKKLQDEVNKYNHERVKPRVDNYANDVSQQYGGMLIKPPLDPPQEESELAKQFH